ARPEAIIADDGAHLLEDWTPLGRCLDWRVGLQTWATRGDQLFSRQEIPHLAHDSGALSRRSAQLLADWCKAQAKKLPKRIRIVELGMGTGLHLRYMLEQFEEITAQQDWASRLDVYATDVNRGLLDKAANNGLFEGLKATVTLGAMSALEPGQVLPLQAESPVDLRGKVHMYVANYVLDLMPIDIVRRRKEVEGSRWEAVLARTWLTQTDRLQAYSDLTIEGLQSAIEGHQYQFIADVFPLLQVEMRTFPMDINTHPDKDLLVKMAELHEDQLGEGHALLVDGTVVCHSAGAMNVAERLVDSLAAQGFVLIRDVALHQVEDAATPRGYQHYGPTAAAGLNLIEFDACYGKDAPKSRAFHSTAPERDGPRAQASRLLTKRSMPKIQKAFQKLFDAKSFEEVEAFTSQARTSQDPNEAMSLYRKALNEEPRNWVVMLEAARVAIAVRADPQLPLVLLRRALEINPEYSADLWNTYGEALWNAGEKTAAGQAYRYALDVNEEHAEARYGLAFCEAERGRFGTAMRHIGRALSDDPQGRLRGKILELLDVCLRGQQNREGFEQAQRNARATR
ncbi:MAG TPA: hypothetical protein DCQ06_03345, partial [Myxococcales bacterium]|nr:hypothetical protein [Myxococcales bacterium]